MTGRQHIDFAGTVFLSSPELDEVQRVAIRVAIIKDGHTYYRDESAEKPVDAR